MPDSPETEDIAQQIADARVRYERLRQDNQQQEASLAKYGVVVDGEFINRIRVDTLVAFIFNRMGSISPEVRELLTWLFECEFEEHLGEKMADVKAQVRKADLSAGARVPQNMLAKMWEASQAFQDGRGRGNGKG